MATMEDRRCFVKRELGLHPQTGSHLTWQYVVPTERDNSFFWLKAKCDSLDFQVIQHSLKNPVVGWRPKLAEYALTAI